MTEPLLKKLSDIATEAHTRIQLDFEYINPVIGINQGMRSVGIPADVMTIDCLKTNKRIIIILHDEQPSSIQYQFSHKNEDPEDEFKSVDFEQVTSDKLYDWMKIYFSGDVPTDHL